jgi:hypothetical protein
MRRFLGRISLLSVVLAASAATAHAQYVYPRGYSGWNGWGGGSTVGGDTARGMGVFAAGAGAYNQQTAQARSMNANTAMQVNDYMYAVNQRNAATERQILAQRQANVNETADAMTKRLRNNPTPRDIRSGDALNVVLEDLTNPAVYTQVAQRATQPIDSRLVKNIVFNYAANMIAISLDDLSTRGVPDVLLTNSEFQPDRDALRALIHKAREESRSPGSQVSPETLANCRVAIKALRTKVEALLPQGSTDRDQAVNFLKALYGLTKMLESPDVSMFLKELDTLPTTTLGQLLTFMHSFNLQFGFSKTPEQGAAYDQLYPMLVRLRDQGGVQMPPMSSGPPPLQDPKKVTSFFSGMDFNHFQPQPAPVGAAPPPPQPR